jgi:L-amino acid N-acyltransferase YncA
MNTRRTDIEGGLSASELIFRDLTGADIPILAQLHATAWRQTYEPIFGKTYQFPTAELRERQWKEKFANRNANWFCIVAELKDRLIGFVSGNGYSSEELPNYNGELNKLYLLKEYQKSGTGKKLFMAAVDRFLKNGIISIVAFTEPQNSVGKFFEYMGGKKIVGQQGEFHGAYGWDDLKAVPKY